MQFKALVAVDDGNEYPLGADYMDFDDDPFNVNKPDSKYSSLTASEEIDKSSSSLSNFRVIGSARVTSREDDDSSTPLYSIDTLRNQSPASSTGKAKVNIPDNLLDYATMLYKEESVRIYRSLPILFQRKLIICPLKLSLQRIAEILKADHNSDAIVAAIIDYLRQNVR